MQIGIIAVDRRKIGVVTVSSGRRDYTADLMGNDSGLMHLASLISDEIRQSGHGGERQRGDAPSRGPSRGEAKGAYPDANLGPSQPETGSRVHGRFAEARDRARQELQQKPWLNEKAMHVFAGENTDPKAATALWESAINRSAVRGTSLEKEIRRHQSEGGYYAGYSGHVDPHTRTVLERARDRALNYSNVSNYATDNSSNQPGNNLAERDVTSGHFTERSVYNREHFFAPLGQSPKWHQSWKGMVYESETMAAANSAKAKEKSAANKPSDPETMAP